MTYKVILTAGYEDDVESITRGIRGDVLIVGIDGEYYNPIYIALERVNNEFSKDKVCYMDDCLVILHEVTKDNILASIAKLHHWQFQKRWIPMTNEQLEKYFTPVNDWVSFEVQI